MTAPTKGCALHGVPATHRCDGCDRLLCESCFEVGHRLLFCKHCGERALPLVDEGPANARVLARERIRKTPYSLQDALGYPFRGLGGFVYWATLLFVSVLAFSVAFAPRIMLIPVVVMVLVTIYLSPALSFQIVRSTSRFSDELPDWPDFTAPGNLGKVGAMLVLAVLAIVPAALLLSVAGCDNRLVAGDPECSLLVGAGLVVGLALFVPACGATASFGNSWLSIRWDLHARALLRTWQESVRIALMISGLYLVASALGFMLSALPVVGWLASLAVLVYTWFLAMHLIGLFVRHHEETLETVYYD